MKYSYSKYINNQIMYRNINTCSNLNFVINKVISHQVKCSSICHLLFCRCENPSLYVIVRRQAKSCVFLMINIATKVLIILQGRKYHFIFGGKISDRSNRRHDPRKVTWGQISNLVKSVQNCYMY